MRKLLLFTLALLLATACKETPAYTITGNTGGAGDTLLIFGLDSRHDKIEKVISDKQGTFAHKIETSHVVPLGLLLPSGEVITLIAEPQTEATLLADKIKGEGWIVKGGKEQALYDSISGVLKNATSNSQRQVHLEEFTRANPLSVVNVEIIRQYMVDIPTPNNNFILTRIKNLGGTLQDHDFFAGLQGSLDNKSSNTLYKMFPTFKYTTAEGKTITQKEYKNKMLIVNFWAAWDSLSRAQMKELSKLYAQKDTSKVKMLNISLDYDTALWRRSIIEDSIAGDNVCDGKAWNNETVKRFSLSNLTFTLVTSPYQRIDLFGLNNENFLSATDSLALKYFKEKKEGEERAKARRANRKRK